MRRGLSLIGVVLLLVSLTLAGLAPAPAGADDEEHRLDALEREKRAIAERIAGSSVQLDRITTEQHILAEQSAALQQRLADLEVRSRTLADELSRIDSRISQTELEHDLVRSRIRQSELRLAALEERRSLVRADLDRAQATLADHLRLASRLQRTRRPVLLELLTGRTSSEVASQARLALYIEAADRRVLQRIEAIVAVVEDERRRETAERATLDLLAGQSRDLLANLDRARADRAARLVDIAATKREQETSASATSAALEQRSAEAEAALRRLDDLRAEEERLDRALRALLHEIEQRSRLDARLRFAGVPKLAWPLTGPLTSYFGWRTQPWPSFHTGIDIAAPLCAPVRAAAEGLVMTVGKPYGDGAHIVALAHSRNATTMYAHLTDRAPCPPPVAEGQWVRAGQIVGYVGMTGRTTGPHLHFMLSLDGKFVDPLPYLP